MDITHLSFPGIGIGEFDMDKFAIHFGDRGIAWYGVIIVTGIILAFLYVFWRSRPHGLVFDDLLDLAIFTVVPGVIGARIYFVIFDALKNPGRYSSFRDIIAIWDGGLAIYGGIICGALGAIITLYVKKIKIPVFLDVLGPSVMLAQAIGRWGNFVNGEAHGGTTGLPWRMGVGVSQGSDGVWNMIYVHPTFLYESLWNVLGFVLIQIFRKKKQFDGQLACAYLAWYGLGRMFIEAMRTDSLYIGSSGIRVSQLVGGICFAVFAFMFFFFAYRNKSKTVSVEIYKENAKHREAGLKLIDKYGEYLAARAEKKAAAKQEKAAKKGQ